MNPSPIPPPSTAASATIPTITIRIGEPPESPEPPTGGSGCAVGVAAAIEAVGDAVRSVVAGEAVETGVAVAVGAGFWVGAGVTLVRCALDRERGRLRRRPLVVLRDCRLDRGFDRNFGIRNNLDHRNFGIRNDLDRCRRIEEFGEQRVVVEHGLTQIFCARLTLGMAERDLVRGPVLAEGRRMIDRHIGEALLEVALRVAPGVHDPPDQSVGIANGDGRIVDEAHLHGLPLVVEALAFLGREGVDIEL